jgi:hypothetical protein
MNFEESLKVNTPIRNERIQNLVNSSYLVSQLNSKESDGFILQKTDSSNTANNDITRKHNTNNNITEISKQTQLDRRDAAFYKVSLMACFELCCYNIKTNKNSITLKTIRSERFLLILILILFKVCCRQKK